MRNDHHLQYHAWPLTTLWVKAKYRTFRCNICCIAAGGREGRGSVTGGWLKQMEGRDGLLVEGLVEGRPHGPGHQLLIGARHCNIHTAPIYPYSHIHIFTLHIYVYGYIRMLAIYSHTPISITIYHIIVHPLHSHHHHIHTVWYPCLLNILEVLPSSNVRSCSNMRSATVPMPDTKTNFANSNRCRGNTLGWAMDFGLFSTW